LANGIVLSYAYDNANRLTGITYTQGATTLGNLTYSYDANGRRTGIGGSYAQADLPAAISTAAYNGANQLTTWGSATLGYDANGNLTGDGSNTYTWDARNQLASLSGGAVASFQYDALGRRIGKTVAGTATGFLYDGINPVQELTGSTPKANLLTGLGVDETFSRTDVSGTRHFLTDALGSTLALTDGAGTVQTSYSYEPYGKTTASGAANDNSIEYTGRENDGTGLYFYRARYYHPGLQRFVAEDPIGLAGGINQYAYVVENPISYTDPMGLRVSEMYRPLAGGAYPIWYHTAVNVNGEIYGFHPEGVRRENPADYQNWGGHEKVIYPDDSQDARVLKYLRDAADGKNPKFNDHNYDAWNNNCFDFARGAYDSK
jgi:RHS repeat-associated protein